MYTRVPCNIPNEFDRKLKLSHVVLHTFWVLVRKGDKTNAMPCVTICNQKTHIVHALSHCFLLYMLKDVHSTSNHIQWARSQNGWNDRNNNLDSARLFLASLSVYALRLSRWLQCFVRRLYALYNAPFPPAYARATLSRAIGGRNESPSIWESIQISTT